MNRVLCWIGATTLVLGLVAAPVAPGIAQDDPNANPAFSDVLLSTLGLPEIELRQPVDGPVEGVPADLAAGRYLVSLTAAGHISAYVNVVQIPAATSHEDATAQLLDTARTGIPHEGYLYAGGSYARENQTVRFVIDLEPGEWHVAASRQSEPGGEAIMALAPLPVTGEAPAPTEISTSVTMELRDESIGGVDGILPSGPRIWAVTNVGAQPRQVVIWRSPAPVAPEQAEQILTGLMSGTPTAGGSTLDQFTWVAYTAILSPQRTIWEEFDLAPGSYLAASYVVGPASSLPALVDGTILPFLVEDEGATGVAPPPTATPCPPSASSGRVVAVANDVTIHLTDQGFDPAVIQATSGHDLTITLVNTGARSHAFALEFFEIDVELAPGETTTVTVTPGDRGDAVTYPFTSDAAGDECMHGTLVFYV